MTTTTVLARLKLNRRPSHRVKLVALRHGVCYTTLRESRSEILRFIYFFFFFFIFSSLASCNFDPSTFQFRRLGAQQLTGNIHLAHAKAKPSLLETAMAAEDAARGG